MSWEIATRRLRRRVRSDVSRSYTSASRSVVSVSVLATAARSFLSAVPTWALSRVYSKLSAGRTTSACSAVTMLLTAPVSSSPDGTVSQVAAERAASQFLSTGGTGSSPKSCTAFCTVADHSARRLLLSWALRRRTASRTRWVTFSAIRSRDLTSSVQEKAAACLAMAPFIPAPIRTCDLGRRASRASRMLPGSHGDVPVWIRRGEPSAITVLTSTTSSSGQHSPT